MNDKDIEKDYKLKISQLLKYNSFYYNKNHSLVTDQEYDELKKNIIDLEKKYKFLKDKNSPNNIVGYHPSKLFKKIPHKVPMLSLSNAFSENDLINF